MLWSTQQGSAGPDWLTDAKVDAQGRIWLFGETEGSFVAGRAPTGSVDLLLLRLDADRQLQRAWQWGGPDDEVAGTLAVDSCGSATRRRARLWFPQGQ